MSVYDYINCPSCNTTHRIPPTDQPLKITCKNCHEVFYKNLAQPPSKHIKKFVIPAIIIAIVVALIWFNQDPKRQWTESGKSFFSLAKSSNWVTIAYGGLVNMSILTHSGQTVGEIIRTIPNSTDDFKGQVQEYLEPYSILCHDVLLSTIEPNTLPLVNILAHYPEGSEQPAWVDLFREGHFQLYYNNHLVRVFLKGSNPNSSFEKFHSVIRHPIQDVINNKYTSIENVEVYVFNNDYATTEIRLNTIPKVYAVDELDLSPKRKPIDLTSIEDFLSQGVILEAVEVDSKKDLYFYGRKAQRQTLAGHPLSLSDIAVIYRSVFHYGHNAPYISLDKHEDNRYAKVNFGGHLENTHTGSVVLEADKLFKTLSTGLDPNTHKLVKSKIIKEVPHFLTKNERSFLDDVDEGQSQIRYWFYPDSIGTVTDGSIGAVLTHQFLADVERMDIKVNVSNGVRKTIDHLNQNFSQYERADNTYKELGTVGRIMALVNWLREMNMDDRIELDELLSVNIPAFTTPKRTNKMLAVTVIAYPGNTLLNSGNVGDYSRVYYISDLLDKYRSSTTDEFFLEVAGDYYSKIDISEIAPEDYIALRNALESIERQIEQRKIALNRNSARDVNNYNKLIDQQHVLVNKVNNMSIEKRAIATIAGGINLRPSQFKQTSWNKNSPKLREIAKIKSTIKNVGKISKSGNWIRSNTIGIAGSRINKLSANSWTSSKSVNGNIEYYYHSNSGDYASMSQSRNLQEWRSETSINGSQDIVQYSETSNKLKVYHGGLINESTGGISSDGKRIEFVR